LLDLPRMNILLARHGETPWNAEGRYQGQVDIPLSEVGISQATALGQRLHALRIDRAVASPLARATRTAQLALGESRAAQLTFDEGLMEIGHGDWEGLLASEIDARDPQRLRAWRDAPDTVQMPGVGGESLQQVFDRAWPAFARACAGLSHDDTLLVGRTMRSIACCCARCWASRWRGCGRFGRHPPRSTCCKAIVWTRWTWCA